MNEKNKHLHSAKNKKDDEFYTRFEDIEKELGNYDESKIKFLTKKQDNVIIKT